MAKVARRKIESAHETANKIQSLYDRFGSALNVIRTASRSLDANDSSGETEHNSQDIETLLIGVELLERLRDELDGLSSLAWQDQHGQEKAA